MELGPFFVNLGAGDQHLLRCNLRTSCTRSGQ